MAPPINVIPFPKQYQHLTGTAPTLGTPLITAVSEQGEAKLFTTPILSVPPAGAKAVFTPAVQDLQRALIEWGFPPKGGADGLFGDNTRLAVEALQRKLGVQATGEWTGTMADVIRRDLQLPTSTIRQWQRSQGLAVPGGAPPAVVPGAAPPASEPSGFQRVLTSPWTWVGLALVGAGVFWLKSSAGPYTPLAERGVSDIDDADEDEDEDEDEDDADGMVDGEVIKVITSDDVEEE